jgi:predicted nucleic acid-binding protein
VTLIGVSTAVFEAAGRLDPVGVRSLDTLHLAAALDLGDDLEGLITYDDRLAAAATSKGVTVVTPRERA